MLYLTVYMDTRGNVQAHTAHEPLAFEREVGDRQAVLYRAVIAGALVEDDVNDG